MRLVRCNKPIVSVEYELRERGPLLAKALVQFERERVHTVRS